MAATCPCVCLVCDETDGCCGGRLCVPKVVLSCPHCDTPHVDRGKWATFPHRTHRCVDGCGKDFEDPFGKSIGVSPEEAEFDHWSDAVAGHNERNPDHAATLSGNVGGGGEPAPPR